MSDQAINNAESDSDNLIIVDAEEMYRNNTLKVDKLFVKNTCYKSDNINSTVKN